MGKKKIDKKIVRIAITLFGIGIICLGCIILYKNKMKANKIGQGQEYNTLVEHDGKIFLYGETHSEKKILEKELELWDQYYQSGVKDLFVELPYYTAEFLNIWIKSEDNVILNELYEDWDGSALHSIEVKEFYQAIKEKCPDTIFHGTDVGHQYNTTGERYIEYLVANGKEASEEYSITKDSIEQGKYYYTHSDPVYRENQMVKNFIREFDKLNGATIMGIYGSAHTQLNGMDYATNTIPCMANQLRNCYKEKLFSEDLSIFAYGIEPLKTDIIQVGNKEYQALYYGKQDLTAFAIEYQYREFWKLVGAYNDWKEQPVTGNVLPYHNFPMPIEKGQIFVVDYSKPDGSVVREYYRSDGNYWNGLPVTEGFVIH